MKKRMKPWGLCFCFVAAFLIGALLPGRAEAAQYKRLYVSEYERTKVGSRFIWAEWNYDSDFDKCSIYAAKSSTAKKGNKIAESTDGSILTDGARILYLEPKSLTKCDLCGIGLNGKNKKKYGTIKGNWYEQDTSVIRYYNKQILYYTYDYSCGSVLHTMSLTTGKQKTVWKGGQISFLDDGKYIYLTTLTKTSLSIKVFDCERRKITKSVGLKRSSGETFGGIHYISDKYLYFVVYGKNGMNKIYRLSSDGKGTVKLIKKLTCDDCFTFGNGYFCYSLNGKYYYYSIGQGVSKKISESSYRNYAKKAQKNVPVVYGGK